MRKAALLIAISALSCFGCKPTAPKQNEIDSYSYELGVVGGFSELINAGVKQLALSAALSPGEMDLFIEDAERIALKYNVSVFRESDLVQTNLFPSDVAEGKDVLLLYKGSTLEQYLELKADIMRQEESGVYGEQEAIELARRFGRLLSYSSREINHLLAQNTSFRTMDDFGIRASNLFLYYKDLLNMQNFCQDKLDLTMVADQGWAKIYKVSDTGFLGIVDEKRGMHSFTAKKAVNLGFIIDDLEGWFEYSKKNRLFEFHEEELGIDPEMRYKAFVGFCPEEYYLEFDRFFPHDDNMLLLKYLNE